MSIERTRWGVLSDGTQVDMFTLTNKSGMEASIATYGGTITRLTVPDRTGTMGDVILGLESLEAYVADECYFGSLIGRVANRIGHARFSLGGNLIELEKNCGEHHLHGGSMGFHRQVWDAEPMETEDGPGVLLRYTSPDQDQGYPGKVDCSAIYTLNDHGLRLDIAAVTDKPTVLNMTSHAYFNLSARPGADCLAHELCIQGSRTLAMDTENIPTGRLTNVEGTQFDFTNEVPIGSRIPEQGYDEYYVLDDIGPGLRLAASVYEPVSGRAMEVWTTSPGVQFYSGNHIPDLLPGKGGLMYCPRSGFCLETQGFVDAPNHPEFPQVTLAPGQEFLQTTLFNFFVK
ncbi:aldose epimerase family protein [uncultured Pseudodesulfovibrio sp.]|uniref:aldose epimerase family protein n=1 Tax=uncultured Pseudodesulfovibrio sp. TaxID=2035858 RepID=UPI0029C6AC2D|nr:aldose epimerase family protein [uncultured Pseudodesulfovibrio sp.]